MLGLLNPPVTLLLGVVSGISQCAFARYCPVSWNALTIYGQHQTLFVHVLLFPKSTFITLRADGLFVVYIAPRFAIRAILHLPLADA